MESHNSGSAPCITTTTTTAVAATAAAAAAANATTVVVSALTPATTISTISAGGSSCSNPNSSNTASVLVSSGNLSSGIVVALPLTSQTQQQQQQLLPMDIAKADDTNNSSQASGISESQRSLSAAPSASSSPISSPPSKLFGRNANGTMVATSRPSNEAEIQLYRLLQRASLLSYYDTLLEMGGDDVQQLYEAGEEEFLEIMALVGMASKPLHVRRLQKALHEWANNPTLFQGPMLGNVAAALCETPTKCNIIFKPTPSPPRSKFPAFNTTPAFNPTPLLNTVQTSSSHLLAQICTPAISVPVIQPHTPLPLPTTLPSTPLTAHQASVAGTSHQVTSSSPQLTPVLTEMQVSRITLGAEKIARQLPQREPRAQTSKKRTSRELEQVIAMSEHDPRRMDEIRKYSAIYGRFDCKRRPEKPLTLHEVCVNEAAAQLCRLVPALLTRRDELFPLARQIVKDAGFGHSASIARYGSLLPQVLAQQQVTPRSSVLVDCESSDSSAAMTSKRQRLSSTETAAASDLTRETGEDSRYNLFAMYQKFAKPSFDLTDISKFSLAKSDIDDNDNDSRFSFSNSSSPSMPSCLEGERVEGGVKCNEDVYHASCQNVEDQRQRNALSPGIERHQTKLINATVSESVLLGNSSMAGVQVISAAGGHIIAVANPALALSPTLNEALSLKREANSPDH